MADKKAIYPGSFDPITDGHIDIVRRALKIFSSIVIAVLVNPDKRVTFSIEKRKSMIEESLKECGIKNVAVETFDGLLVNFMKTQDCNIIIRGLRMLSDFEFEFQMSMMNKKLYEDFEAVYFIPAEKYSYLSSGLVKHVHALGGNISSFVPECIIKKLDALKKQREKP